MTSATASLVDLMVSAVNDDGFDPHAVEAGDFDFRVLAQTEWWVNAKGRAIRTVDMDDEYLSNVIGYLVDRRDPVVRWCAVTLLSDADVVPDVVRSDRRSRGLSEPDKAALIERLPLVMWLRMLLARSQA